MSFVQMNTPGVGFGAKRRVGASEVLSGRWFAVRNLYTVRLTPFSYSLATAVALPPDFSSIH